VLGTAVEARKLLKIILNIHNHGQRIRAPKRLAPSRKMDDEKEIFKEGAGRKLETSGVVDTRREC